MDRAARRRVARGNGKRIAGVWLSNAPWAPTGYGQQTAQVIPRIAADGHRIAIAANYGLEAASTSWEGIDVWPRGMDVYSQDMVGPYYRDWSKQHPGMTPIMFTLYDVHVFTSPQWDSMNVVPWVPVDHMPIPPAVQAFCAKTNVHPIAMSRFGLEQLQRKDIDAHYAPHAIDMSVYRHADYVQQENGKRITGRELMSLSDDHFVVLIANANKGVPSRKAFGEQLLAFSIFAQRHDDARLFIHSEQFGAMTGIQFDPLIQACGIADKVKFINQYQMRMGLPPEALAVLYSSADVMLNPTMGEGFGITQLEAQACGLRVITQDFSAQAELAGPGSIKVSGQPYWDATQHAWFSTPSVPHMVDALEEMYAQGRVRSPEAAAWARANYDAEAVYARHWRPILDHLAEEIGEEGPCQSSTDIAP